MSLKTAALLVSNNLRASAQEHMRPRPCSLPFLRAATFRDIKAAESALSDPLLIAEQKDLRFPTEGVCAHGNKTHELTKLHPSTACGWHLRPLAANMKQKLLESTPKSGGPLSTRPAAAFSISPGPARAAP